MNIGLQYDHGTLFVVLDASLSLGPISLGLLGFGFGVHLDSSLFNDPKVEVKLSGLAAGLNKPPLSLDGLFRVVKPNPPPGGVAAETNPSLDDLSKEEDVIYSGGVVISIIPYGILAFGSYGIIQGHKTFFIFGQLEGPLVELGFATINGVKLGFG
jgi:hypothetical protein